MAEYIEREALLKDLELLAKYQCGERQQGILGVCETIKRVSTTDVVEVVHGEWELKTHSFYADTWDESVEFIVYITANCNKCDRKHPDSHEVYSKRLYAPEDADESFRFDREVEEALALKEFMQRSYNFAKYCPNCGAKMDGERRSEE